MKEINKILKKIEILKITMDNLLYWDKVTYMPSGGNNFRNEVIITLSEEIQNLYNSIEIEKFLETQYNTSLEKTIQKKLKNKLLFTKIPTNLLNEYKKLLGESEALYDIAREKNDFSIIKDNLKKIVNFQIKFSKIWNLGEHPYDSILKFYDSNSCVKNLDEFFQQLKISIINILNSKNKKIEYFNKNIPIFKCDHTTQKDLTTFLLSSIDFDFSRGRFDISHHPMTLANTQNDVRITTYFDLNDIRPCITTALHEGGHGLYEQDIDSNLLGTLLAEASSMSLHEGQAKFYENMIGRNPLYWNNIVKDFLLSKDELKDININKLINSLNSVTPSLIRMDADELTYNLHIIIRYEIERDLLSGHISVDNLEEIWKDKYQKYLGVSPSNVTEGILQDVHWFSGYWGYFSTYILGNIYSAELYQYLLNKTNIFTSFDQSSLKELHLWFKENIHKYGSSKNPEDILFEITKEKIDPKNYINYLTNKYLT